MRQWFRRMPECYRQCSCRAKIGSKCYATMRRHRKMGHTVPMKRYRTIDNQPVKRYEVNKA